MHVVPFEHDSQHWSRPTHVPLGHVFVLGGQTHEPAPLHCVLPSEWFAHRETQPTPGTQFKHSFQSHVKLHEPSPLHERHSGGRDVSAGQHSFVPIHEPLHHFPLQTHAPFEHDMLGPQSIPAHGSGGGGGGQHEPLQQPCSHQPQHWLS